MQQYSEKMSIFAVVNRFFIIVVNRFFIIVELCCLAKNRLRISRIQYVILDN